VRPSASAGGDTVYIIRAWTQDAQQWCHCISAIDGRQWPQCPVLTYGGQSSLISLPILVPAGEPGVDVPLSAYPQALIVYRGNGQTPVVVGLLNTKGLVTPEQGSGNRGGSADDTRTTEPVREDIFFRAGGATVAIRHVDGAVVIAPASDADIQLSGGLLRVSNAGDASGRLLLAGPTLQYIGQLAAIVSALVSWAVALEIGPTGGPPLIPYTSGDAPPIQDELVTAGAIHVPSTSAADQEET